MKLPKATITSLLSLSVLGHIAIMPSLAQTAPESSQGTASGTGREGYGKQEIGEFCAGVEAKPQPGIQFNGEAVSRDVMQLSPGIYKDAQGNDLLLLENGYFLLQPASNVLTGTEGPDIMLASGIIGGCSREQLSEAIAANNMNAASFDLANAKHRTYGKENIDEFCENTNRSQPEPGIQLDGKTASPEVMTLSAGRYEYPNEGILLFFTNEHYLLRLPPAGNTIGSVMYGANGDNLVDTSGVIGGCSPEHLSEVLARNEIDINSLNFVSPVD